jgi:predicted lactoylglutathione lyase
MGTTQRISPGVTNQPNWKGLNSSVTNVAKTVEKETEIEQEENKNSEDKTPEQVIQIEKQYKKMIIRRENHLKSTYRNLIKTGGGVKNISKGKSNSIGKAGLKSSGKIVNFFSSVGSIGLQNALAEIGFGRLDGKSVENVIDFLVVYCSDSATGMDETAANKASSEVLNQITAESGNDIDKFEQLLKEYVDGNGLSNLLCSFWGYYIFKHLSQRFKEKITQHRGESVSSETFKIIKDDILGRVKVLNESRPISKIDWKGSEGKKEIEVIFESIINILCDEN